MGISESGVFSSDPVITIFRPMAVFRYLLYLLLLQFVFSDNSYTGGFGPRLPLATDIQQRKESFVDLITKNRYAPISAPVQPNAIPSEYPQQIPRETIYFGRELPPVSQPSFPQLVQKPYGTDLSQSSASFNNPFSDRNRLFGIGNQRETFFPQPVANIPTGNQRIYPQDSVPKGPRIDISQPIGTRREIDRFSTNTNRFAKESEIQNRVRVVLPSDFAISPLEGNGKRPTENSLPKITVGLAPLQPNAVFVESPQRSTPAPTPIITPEAPKPFTTYPDYRSGLFPELANYRHDDKRPATGRLGPQGRFGGGTNEFREDLGVRLYGINDQRRPWEHLPHRFGTEPTNAPPNKDYRTVSIETLKESNNPSNNQWEQNERDLTVTDPIAGIPMGRSGRLFPEFTTTVGPLSRQTTTIIGVPLYPEFGTGYQGKSGSGPANILVGGGIQPQNRIDLSGQIADQSQSGIRPYNGPEEITRSHFQRPSRLPHSKLDLLNE